MKKIIVLVIALYCIKSYGQTLDTLSSFNIHTLNSLFVDSNRVELSKGGVKGFRDIIKEKKEILAKDYKYWPGQSDRPLITGFYPSEKDPRAHYYEIGTDYFEIYLASQFLDSTYKAQLLKDVAGELALLYNSFGENENVSKYFEQTNNKALNEYLCILGKVRKMMSRSEFDLLMAFAEKLQRQVYVVRIKSPKFNNDLHNNKFYIILSTEELIKHANRKKKLFTVLNSSHIPSNYVIQTVFEKK